MSKNTRVTFDPKPTIYVQYAWQFAYQQARKSVWEQDARDRGRFARRIIETERILSPILDRLQREKISRDM